MPRFSRWLIVGVAVGLAARLCAAELTCLTWNMCWFPSGKRDLRLPAIEPQRIAAAAELLNKEAPHLLFLQEVRDMETCQALARAMGGQTRAVTCSAFTDEAKVATFQQCAILIRPDARCPDLQVLESGFERWKRKGSFVPSRGYAYAVIQFGEKRIVCYCVHLKANRSHTFRGQQRDIYNRELAVDQLLAAVQARQALPGQRIDGVIIAGDFNTDLDDAAWVSEASLRRLDEAGFAHGFQGVPAAARVTIPAKGSYPDVTFDYLFFRGFQVKTPGRVVSGAPISDHNPAVVVLVEERR